MVETPLLSEKLLLETITTVLSHYVAETDPYIFFSGLLDALLDMTDSEYGFIGEVFHSKDDKPYLKSYATTNISWSEETKKLYEENRKKGMIFSKLNSLYGVVLRTGQLVISNQPSTDPRSYGIPKGHPPLDKFMGMPFYGGGKFLGIVGIANRKEGYDKAIAKALEPFLSTCGNLIQVYQNNQKHKAIEHELHRCKEYMCSQQEHISLGSGYEFTLSPSNLTRNGNPIFLTKKELMLLEILASSKNVPATNISIEKHIWPDLVIGESSLRSLIRRLRQKLPELSIKTLPGVGYILLISG